MNNEIVTSTGTVGVGRRSHDRLYITLAEPIETYSDISQLHERAKRAVGRSQRLSRAVIRGIVSTDVIKEVAESMPECIETALQLSDYDREDSWLVTLAHNVAGRNSTIVDRQTMIEATSQDQPVMPDDAECPEGYTIIDSLSVDHYGDLFRLWGPMFEWSEQQIANFAKSLEHYRQGSPDSSLWFSAMTNPGGALVSAAMAERINMQGFSNQVSYIESTEWRTLQLDESQPRRLLPFVLRSLHSHIRRDVPSGLIVAECNYASRSDIAGRLAGMVVPDRLYAPQILTQNVAVFDGLEPHDLRDFTYMQLPQNIGGVA